MVTLNRWSLNTGLINMNCTMKENFGRRPHKLGKLVSDPSLLYVANEMFKLREIIIKVTQYKLLLNRGGH